MKYSMKTKLFFYNTAPVFGFNSKGNAIVLLPCTILECSKDIEPVESHNKNIISPSSPWGLGRLFKRKTESAVGSSNS